MKDLIDEKIDFFSRLQLPLAGIWGEVSQWILPPIETVPKELFPSFEKLQQIVLLAKQIAANEQLNTLEALNKNRRNTLALLRKKIAENEKKLESSYQLIEDCIDEELIGTLSARNRFSNRGSQKQRVAELLAQARQELNNIEQLQAQLSLYDKNTEFHVLENELQNCGIVPTADFEKLSRILQEDIQFLTQALEKLQYLQQKLAFHLSRVDIESKKGELEILLLDLQAQYKDKPPQNSALLSSFKGNAAQALEEKRNRMSDLQSRLSINSWYNWTLYQGTYNENLETLTQEIGFLEILALEQKINGIEQNIHHLDQLARSQENISDITSLEDLVESSIELLLSLQEYDLCNNSPALQKPALLHCTTDLLLEIVSCLSQTSALLDKKNQAIALVSQLATLKRDITALQIKTKCIALNKNWDFEKMREQAAIKMEQQPKFFERAEIYKSFLETVAQQESLEKQLKEVQHELRQQKKQSQQLKSLKTDSAALEVLKKNLETTIDELLQLPPLKEETTAPILELLSEIQSNPILSLLEEWHNKIEQNAFLFPTDIKKWYQQLFETLKSQTTTEDQLLKACQLLQDIHFESAYPDNQQYPVLENYQKICPQPSQNIDTLLALKPAIAPIKKPLTSLLNPSLKKTLDEMYLHSKKLKSNYPAESKLLKQATCILHQAALDAEQGKKILSATAMLQDPHYYRLKKHRGAFFQFWEQVESCFYRILAMLNPESKQSDNPSCFFKTTSENLLKKAEQQLEEVNRTERTFGVFLIN